MIKTKTVVPRIILIISILAALLLAASPAYAADPTVTTDAATGISANGATLNGTLSSAGDVGTTIYLSFQYASDEYYTGHGSTYDKTTPETAWTVADGVTTFSTTISSLASSATYHFRARVRFGSSYAYGADDDFTTTMLAPDVIPSVVSLQAYTDLVDTDDCLFVILADIPYEVTPSIPVNRSYYWSLMESGVAIGSNVGYAMYERGYGFNVYSLYFSAADAIDWGNETDYSVQLDGDDDVFSVAPSYGVADDASYQVTSTTWVTSSDYNITLAEDLIDIAKILEQEWQIILLDEQDTKTVLSSNGEKLFRNAIPNVQNMAPSIFFVQQATADTSNRVWGTDLTDEYQATLAGADEIIGTADDNWIAASLTGVGDWLNIPFLLIIGLLCLVVCVIAIWQSGKRFGNPMPGYMASFVIAICFGMLAMGLTWVALIALALVIAGGWLLFMRRA